MGEIRIISIFAELKRMDTHCILISLGLQGLPTL